MKTRVFFYSNHREDDPSIGITKKVHAQISALRERGYEVFFSAYIHGGVGIFDNTNTLLKHYKVSGFYGKLGHWKRRAENLDYSASFIQENGFSILYMRFHYWDRYSVHLVKTAKQSGVKVVVEAHTYPYVKKRQVSIPMRLIYFLDNVYMKAAKQYIDLVAAITVSEDRVWGCKTVKINNAINIDDMEVRDVKKIDTETFQIVCVANESATHGIPRILRGIAEYSGKCKVNLNLIGEYSKKTLNLVETLQIKDKVNVVGKLCGEQLAEYYAISSVGVGVLAWYLLDVHAGGGLKIKEYMAVGLPFFTSASPDAEINQYPYAFVVPEDDSPVDVEKLICFVQGLHFTQEDADRMHTEAIRQYRWSNEFDKVFSVLD